MQVRAFLGLFAWFVPHNPLRKPSAAPHQPPIPTMLRAQLNLVGNCRGQILCVSDCRRFPRGCGIMG